MKKLILILLFPIISIAQKNFDNGANLSMVGRGYVNVPTVTVYKNDSIVIKGDSLSAIKLLYKELERIASERDSEHNALDYGVTWSNTVPDCLKKSKEWIKFQKAINRLGYKTTILKK